jgi:hypothetical protein
MQGERNKRIADSSEQIAGSKEKSKDNGERQRNRREENPKSTARNGCATRGENPRRRRKAAPTLKSEVSGERRKMFVIGLIV